MQTHSRLISLILLLIAPAIVCATSINIERWQTKNGVQVLFLSERSVPMVDFSITFWAGSAYDGSRYGLAAISNELIKKGAGDLSEQAFSEALESLGTQLRGDINRDLASFQLRSLSKEESLNKSVALLALMLKSPRFSEESFNLLKVQQKHARQFELQSPAKVANDEIFKLLYKDHPYAHPILGTLKSINALSLNDAKTFFKTYYASNHTTLAIVGDLTKDQAKRYAETITQSLTTSRTNLELPPPPQANSSQSVHLPFNSTQTAIRVAKLGIDYYSENYFPLLVGNYTLGGSGLTSQLAMEVREKRGLTYGVYSSFSRLQQKGPFIISLETKNKTADLALNITDKTLSNFLQNGPSKQELLLAKQYLTGSFPIQLSSNGKLLAVIARMGAYQLPSDYLETYLSNIEAVKKEHIVNAFNEVVDKNKLTTLIVGSQ